MLSYVRKVNILVLVTRKLRAFGLQRLFGVHCAVAQSWIRIDEFKEKINEHMKK